MALLFGLYDFYVRKDSSEMRSLLESKRKFVRFVSHEVRTPLNTVVLGLKLMESEVQSLKQDDEDIEETGSRLSKNEEQETHEGKTADIITLSQDILSSAGSAVAILNDLLNYDKIEMGQLSLEPTVIPIWSLIERTGVEFKLPTKAKNIKLVLDYSKLADPEKTPSPSSTGELSMEVKDKE